MGSVIKRDGKGDIIEETRSTSQQNYIMLKKSRWGDVTWEVKVYNDNPNEIEKEIKTYVELANKMAREEMEGP